MRRVRYFDGVLRSWAIMSELSEPLRFKWIDTALHFFFFFLRLSTGKRWKTQDQIMSLLLLKGHF
jgi:hypothetical protein